MKRHNDAARDLWAQIFERAAADPNATLHESDEESEPAQRELTVEALKEAGWSEAEIVQRNEAERFHGELESANSPGVGPGLEFKLKFLSDRVRKAISKTGETSHGKVEIAIDPKAGVSASLTNVIMTDHGTPSSRRPCRSTAGRAAKAAVSEPCFVPTGRRAPRCICRATASAGRATTTGASKPRR